MTLSMPRRSHLALLLVFILAMGVTTVAAQDDDLALLNTALENSGFADSFAFDFDLNFSLAGVPGAEDEPNVATIAGVGSAGFEAIDLTLNGSAVAGGQETPLALWVRVVDGVLYFSEDGQQWAGTNLDELAPLAEDFAISNFRSGFAESAGSSSTSDDDPAVQESVDALVNTLTSFDLSQYVTTTQLDEDSGLPVAHFVTQVDVSSLMASDDVTGLITALVQLGDPSMSASMSQADMTMVSSLIGDLFTDTSIQLDFYVNTDTEYVERTVLDIQMNVDPGAMGATGQPIVASFNFDINLYDYETAAEIVAPAGAMIMSNIAGMMGLDTPAQIPTAMPPFQIGGPTETPQAVPTVASVEASQAIVANTPTTVTLSANGPTDLVYTGGTNETVTITARSLEESGTLDTTLEVLTPNGTSLVRNDDHGSDLDNLAPFDSAVQDVVLPSAGDYIVRVSTFSGAGAGDVEVTVLSDSAPVPQVTAVAPVNATPTPVDVVLTGETDTVTGEVPAGSQFTYNFNGRPNQVTTITVIAGNSGDLDPKVTLIGPNGDVLAENDDHTDSDPNLGSLDSRISDFVLPSEGMYAAVVSGFANTSGSFEMTIERAVDGGESIVTPVAPISTPAASGETETIAGQVRAGETFTFDLSAQAGDVYTITVRGQDEFDPRLIISDPEGFVAAENDDHGTSDRSLGQFDSQVSNLIIQEGGTYTLEVTDFSGNAGTFDLIIETVLTGAPLGAGQDEVSLGEVSEGGLFTTTIDLSAGEFVGVTIRAVSGDLDPQVALIAPDGSVVAENDDHADFDSTLGRFDSRIPRTLVNATGTYTIEVTAYSGSGSFTVTVNTLAN